MSLDSAPAHTLPKHSYDAHDAPSGPSSSAYLAAARPPRATLSHRSFGPPSPLPHSYLAPAVLAYLKQPLIGSTCGILGRLIDFPFDTIKTRLQTASLDALQARLVARAQSAATGIVASPAPLFTRTESPLQCLQNTIKHEGLRGLYRGCMTPCMGAAIEDSISFSVYHWVSSIIGSRTQSGEKKAGRTRPENLTIPQVFFAGSCGGMTTSFMLTPLELIKCRLQVDRVEAGANVGGRVPKYKSTLDCLLRSVREEGLRVLYRGHSATFIREGLGTGCWFATYETGLRTLAPGVPRDSLSTSTVLLSGALSGMVLNIVPYPFDTAKSVLQTLQGPSVAAGGARDAAAIGVPRGLMDAFSLIVQTEGFVGLYRGITPALMRAVPANAAVFLMYESLHKLLKDWD